jgi:hypothetical protein
MDPKLLEEKLEKDNITLKEHILKLQNTIKNIKSEINYNNSSSYINSISNIETSTNKSKNNSPKNKIKTNININLKDDNSDEEINNLKFSFKNIKNEQKLLQEKRKKRQMLIKSTEGIKEENFENEEKENENYKINNNNINNNQRNFNHIYKDNFSKIKNEKNLIEKMENVRNLSNIKTTFNNYGNHSHSHNNNNSNSDSEKEKELNKFHKVNSFKKKIENIMNNENDNFNEEDNFDNNYRENLHIFNSEEKEIDKDKDKEKQKKLKNNNEYEYEYSRNNISNYDTYKSKNLKIPYYQSEDLENETFNRSSKMEDKFIDISRYNNYGINYIYK